VVAAATAIARTIAVFDRLEGPEAIRGMEQLYTVDVVYAWNRSRVRNVVTPCTAAA